MNDIPTFFSLDSSSLYFMAQIAPDHTNVYRFTITLDEAVCPQALQQATDRIYSRFPTILAGFQPGAKVYTLVPTARPPQVQPDPGFLRTLPKEELDACGCRIYYQNTQIILELFHALTDGYGAMALIRALVGEYLHLHHQTETPEREAFLLSEPDWDGEWEDAYPRYSGKPITSLPRRISYRVPGGSTKDPIGFGSINVSTLKLRQAAKNAGVTVTTLLSTLMAEAVMEVQHDNGTSNTPVRIMVPVDLRRQFPSKTFRNFVLYALPTLEPADMALTRQQRLHRFREQLKAQLDRDFLAGQITRNQVIQENSLFRLLPTAWKFGLMRISNRLFGESNSSITLTNLGPMNLSEAMMAHIRDVQLFLTPRRMSPYNCGLISCGDSTVITITRYGNHTDLERRFFQKLEDLL